MEQSAFLKYLLLDPVISENTRLCLIQTSQISKPTMLESLTPGLVLVASACTGLLVLGLVIRFHSHFAPYLQRRANHTVPLLPQSVYTPIDPELQQSLYSLPGLLHLPPRSSLAECEIQSSRWSTNLLSLYGPSSPTSPTTPSIMLLSPRRHQVRYSSSANLSALRHSLYSEPNLLLSPSDESCSTFVPEDEDHFPTRRARATSMHQISDIQRSRSRRSRRHSAPILTIPSQRTVVEDSLSLVATESPTDLSAQILSRPPTYSKHCRSRERSSWTVDELQRIRSNHNHKTDSRSSYYYSTAQPEH